MLCTGVIKWEPFQHWSSHAHERYLSDDGFNPFSVINMDPWFVLCFTPYWGLNKMSTSLEICMCILVRKYGIPIETSSMYVRISTINYKIVMGSGYGLVVNRRPAISWTNDKPGRCRHVTSPGHNDLINSRPQCGLVGQFYSTLRNIIYRIAGNSPVTGEFPSKWSSNAVFEVGPH